MCGGGGLEVIWRWGDVGEGVGGGARVEVTCMELAEGGGIRPVVTMEASTSERIFRWGWYRHLIERCWGERGGLWMD